MGRVAAPPTADATGAAWSPFRRGRVIGIGSLPHRDVDEAAAFALREFEIATVPTLPRRSPAEGLIARAIVGLPGVATCQYGSLAVDPEHLADDVPISTDLDGDAFAGLRAFLDLAHAVELDGRPLTWQFVGPVTLGVALQRAGLRTIDAFTIAAGALRQHVTAVADAIAAVLPRSPQLVLLDEPSLVDMMDDSFPIPPAAAVDLISTAMAALVPRAVVGIHCCGPCDVAAMLAAGPQVVSIRVDDGLLAYAGYLARFLDDGGVVAWGAVPTDGPVATSAERQARSLESLWSALTDRGVDPARLRRQSLFSPACGLAHHQVAVARRIVRLTGEVARRARRPLVDA